MTHRQIQMTGLSSMLKEGTQHLSGLEEAVCRNIEACKQLAEVTRTSMGPNGMNKIVLNHLDKLFLTSDSATIVNELEVAHPAAKMVVMASRMQDEEIGDATNLVIAFAGELLSNADSLIRMGLHPTQIVEGYVKANKFMQSVVAGLQVHNVEDVRDEDKVADAIRTTIQAKQAGYEDLLAPLIARACVNIMPKNVKAFNVDNVRVAKVLGSGVHESLVMKGMCLGRDAEGTIKHVTNAKIAVYAGALDLPKTETKGTVLLKNAADLENFSKGEEKRMEEFIRGISESGAKVVVSGGAVGELAQHFCERNRIMVIKVMSKFDLQRLCRATGATAVVRVGPPLPEELGFCDIVTVEEIGGSKVTVFRQDAEGSAISTIIVRGSTQQALDDVERAIGDGVNIVKAMTKDGRFVAGGGAAEIELARLVSKEGAREAGLDQYAIKKFAEALEIVPRTLAENAGHDATETISKLYAAHEKGEQFAGVDVNEHNAIADMQQRKVFDHLVGKQTALRLAADAAVTILRVDQIIMSKPAGGPKPREAGPMDD
eukprot:TRINITY_DN4506_c0_g1_i1.p1 TRINITY_DN4506_c0_g1~~TRINITY_DN4506_c0_g1_i1.p1  ORF type:complete len:557 (-),score=162.63 TRINITY_DN4506_c0_g1_i1:39-1670(-)